MAGEVGIEPMASCASGRRSTQPELLAVLIDVLGGPGRSRTDRLRIASAVLSRTELQAQSPAAIAGRRVFNYARTGVNSSERPMRTASIRTNSISPRDKRKGPASGPSRSSRTNPVRVSGAPSLRTTSEPASHRCVLGMRRWRCGSIVATLTRPASLHYSVVVQEQSTASVLGGGRRNQTFSSLAGAGLGDPT